MRTAIYLRISQDKTGEAAGVGRQKEDCRGLVDVLGWQVHDVYEDNDTSASTGKPREHYNRMLADIQAGHIDAIVSWHTDRLYRRLRDLEDLAEICGKHKIMVRTCRSGDFDLSTPTGRMLAGILGAIAKGEVEHKADRWLRSYEQRRQAGRWMGSGPRTFGYNRDGTVCDDEAGVIRQVVADMLNGTSRTAICHRLNTDGWRTTRGGLWSPTTLRNLLVNPRIAGLVTSRGDILGPGTWKPIVDRGTWERIRAIVLNNRDGKPRSPARSLLSGLALCAHPVDAGLCRNPLTRSYTSMPIYQCRTASRSNRHITISARALEEMVEEAAKKRLADPKVREALAARLAGANTAAAALTREIDTLADQIKERETELEHAGKRARLAAMRAIDELDDQLQARRATLAQITPAAVPNTGSTWPDETGQRSALIRIAIAEVLVAPVERPNRRFDPNRVTMIPALDL